MKSLNAGLISCVALFFVSCSGGYHGAAKPQDQTNKQAITLDADNKYDMLFRAGNTLFRHAISAATTREVLRVDLPGILPNVGTSARCVSPALESDKYLYLHVTERSEKYDRPIKAELRLFSPSSMDYKKILINDETDIPLPASFIPSSPSNKILLKTRKDYYTLNDQDICAKARFRGIIPPIASCSGTYLFVRHRFASFSIMRSSDLSVVKEFDYATNPVWLSDHEMLYILMYNGINCPNEFYIVYYDVSSTEHMVLGKGGNLSAIPAMRAVIFDGNKIARISNLSNYKYLYHSGWKWPVSVSPDGRFYAFQHHEYSKRKLISKSPSKVHLKVAVLDEELFKKLDSGRGRKLSPKTHTLYTWPEDGDKWFTFLHWVKKAEQR
jgi:hypothetical protein